MTVRESLLPVLLGIAVGDNGSEDTEERVPFQKTALKREADYEAPQRSDPSHRSSPGLRAGEDAVNIANPPEKEGKEGRGSHSLSPPLHNAVDPLPSVMKEYLRPTHQASADSAVLFGPINCSLRSRLTRILWLPVVQVSPNILGRDMLSRVYIMRNGYG